MLIATLRQRDMTDTRADLYQDCPQHVIDDALQEAATVPDLLDVISAEPYLPIVRVSGMYPARVFGRNDNGWVKVVFDVSPRGVPTNIVVRESSHKRFEKNAVRAVERWKYKPQVVDGQPIEMRSVTAAVRFVVDEASWEWPGRPYCKTP